MDDLCDRKVPHVPPAPAHLALKASGSPHLHGYRGKTATHAQCKGQPRGYAPTCGGQAGAAGHRGRDPGILAQQGSAVIAGSVPSPHQAGEIFLPG